MKLLKHIIQNSFFFYVALTIIIIIIGQLPILLHVLHTPAGSYYPYLDTLAPSDYYYPALVRFGMGPDWLLKIPYVPSVHQGSFIQIFFVFLGKVALVTGLGPAEVFAVSRVLGGIIFIAAAAYFLRQILPRDKARIAFLFFLLAQPLPASLDIIQQDFGMWVWHFGEAARRISSLPSHYTIGKGLAVLALGLIIQAVKTKSVKRAVVSGIVMFSAGMIYPPPVFIILFSLLGGFIVWFVINAIPNSFLDPLARLKEMLKQVQHDNIINRRLVIVIPFVIGVILPLLILRLELNKGFPWDLWQKVELGWNDPTMRFEAHYLRQLGGILFFLPFAFFSIVKNRSFSFTSIMTFVWALSAFLLFPFARYLSLGKFRFTEGVQIVPLAILALYGLTFLKNSFKEIAGFQFSRVVIGCVMALLVINFLVFTGLKTNQSTQALWGRFTNAYLPPYEREALSYLSSNAQTGSVIVADLYSSGYIPIFARVKTIIGFSDFFPTYAQFAKEHDTINELLQGKLSESDAASYLSGRRVDFAYNKFLPFIQPLYPSFLEPIFSNESVMIYKVKNIK